MKLSRRAWVVSAVVAVAVVLSATGLLVWAVNAGSEQSARDAYQGAVSEVRSAMRERAIAVQQLNVTIAEASAEYRDAAALLQASDPKLLADAQTRDALGAAAAKVIESGGMSLNTDGTVDSEAVATSVLVRIPTLPPVGQGALREAAQQFDVLVADITAERTGLQQRRDRIAAALTPVRTARAALIASAFAKGSATAAPELASQETKDAYAAAVAALGKQLAASDQVTAITAYQTAWAAAVASAEEATRNQDPANVEPTYINGILVVNKTYGLPSWWGDGLTAETQSAFDAMQAEAAGLGLDLYISSGFRSYWAQQSIYNRYVAADGQAEADRYSARPGHSEHQSGFTFDLNCICEGFAYTPEGEWVRDNAHRFGFVIRYPEGKESVTGYIWEPWHLRYLGVPVATALYNSGLSLEEYLGITSQYSD